MGQPVTPQRVQPRVQQGNLQHAARRRIALQDALNIFLHGF
jgi:hypothetical protein